MTAEIVIALALAEGALGMDIGSVCPRPSPLVPVRHLRKWGSRRAALRPQAVRD